MTDGPSHSDRSLPFRCTRQVRRLEGTAAGEHAAVGHLAAVMATAAGRHFYAAALGADDVAEYVALDWRGCDGKGGLQDEHERRDESRGARNAYPAYALSHGLS